MPDATDPRPAIIAAAQALDRAGFMPSKSGNVSVRTGRGFWITPSGLPYAETTPDDLVELALDGTTLAGQRRPSSEWQMHTAIYAARSDAQAIVHTHSPLATALSCARLPIPPFHYMIAYGGGADIRCAEYATFGSAELGDHCVAALADRSAVLLANHGVIALGRTLAGARVLAEEVENLARQYLALRGAGIAPVLLDAAEIGRVLDRFRGYGRA